MTEKKPLERYVFRAMGEILQGRYEVIRKLGAGSTGRVHLCRDRLDGRIVALKEIDGPYRDRIRREFKILRSIDHPGVAKALDYSESPTGGAFLVQEYIEGTDLLEASRRADLTQLARWAMDICLTLHYLHGCGVVHGDINPQNVIVSSGVEGAPLLVDFGLTGGKFPADSISGTPAYIAPEILNGASPSPQSDIYSLGAVLYHCIAGETPYSGDTLADMLHAIAHGHAKTLRERVGDVPPKLADVIDRMIARDPVMRYQSAGRVARDLAAYLEREIPPDQWRGGRWPILGREKELAHLSERLDKLRAGEPPGSILIHGPKGIGASRLLEAVADKARTSGIRVLFIPPTSQKDPVKVISNLLPAKEFEPASPVADSAFPTMADEEKAPLRARRRVAQTLREASAEAPVLVAFDDLDDAAESALELARFLSLEFSAGSVPGSPVMIISAFSGLLPDPLSEDVSSGWLAAVELKALPPDAVAAAIEESWGVVPSDAAVKKLAELSGGNPLWLREILKTVTGEDKITEAEAPQSAAELVRASVATLAPETIRVLEAMCVFGHPASIDEIASLMDLKPSDISDSIAELTRYDLIGAQAGFLFPSPSILAKQVDADCAPPVKRRLHVRAAGVLIDRPGGAPPEWIAEHLIGAGDAESAIPYVLRAGEELRARGSHREAALLYKSVLEKASPHGAVRNTTLEGLARSAAPAGLWKLALKALRERLESGGDEPARIRAAFHLEMAHCQQRIGEYDRARRAIGRAQKELDGDDTSPQALKARQFSCLVDIAGGRYEAALTECRSVISNYDLDGATAAPFRAAAGIALVNMARYAEAEAEFAAAIEAFADEGDDAGLVMAYTGLGMARQHAEDYEGALEAYQEAQRAARSGGDLRASATVSMNVATIHHSRGMWEEARLEYNRALLLARQVGASADEVRIQGNLGNLLLYLGDTEAALRLVDRSLAGAERMGLPAYQAYARLLRGDIFKNQGETMGARREYLSARRLFAWLDNAREVAQVDLRLARLYIEMGEKSRARDAISTAAQQAEKLGNRSFGAEAKLLSARWELKWGRADDAVVKAWEAIERIDDSAEIAWEARATVGAALVAVGKKQEARPELKAAYELAVKKRDSIPLEYRDSFLSGEVWEELLSNIESVEKEEGGIPQERWRKLIEINRRLTSVHNLERLLELIMDSVLELVEAERGFLVLVENGKMSVPVARNIDKESIRGARMKISRSIAEEVARNGEPLITVDAQQDKRFDRYASVHDLKLRSILCIPLKVRGDTIGTLYVDNRFREGAFREEDLSVMEAFADQAAIAIDNARRNEELKSSHRKIRELADELERRVDTQSVQIERMRIELARRPPPDDVGSYPGIVGASTAMREVFAMIDRVRASEVPVLIEGESGTGKELVARAIHFTGPRKDKRFLSENCSAIPESLLESELFGYEKGAFTGAVDRKIGLFEMADGGTLFLDEIGDMSAGMQAKLLRVLQEGEMRRVGGQRTFRVDVRIISATHERLEEMVRIGKFREDLYWRLNVVKISIPLLRERREDIPLLVKHFCKKFEEESGRPVEVDDGAMRLLLAYDWPGNVRELENEIRKAAVLGDGMIRPADLSVRIIDAVGGRKTPMVTYHSGRLKSVIEQFEKEYIRKVLSECGGNRALAARRLGIGRRTLYDKLARYNLNEKEEQA